MTLDPIPPQPREESPTKFAVSVSIGVTLLFQFGSIALIKGADLLDVDKWTALPLAVGISQIFLMLLPAYWLTKALQPVPPLELFRVRPISLGTAAMALLGTIALWPIMQLYLLLQELFLVPSELLDKYIEMQRQTETMFFELAGSSTPLGILLSIVVLAMIPAICEEVLFRGAVQGSLERGMRRWRAIALASMLFGALHLQPVTIVPLMLLGAFFGYMTWKSESIYPAMLGHFLFNATGVAGIYLAKNEGVQVEAHTVDDLVPLLYVSAPSAIVAWLVIRWFGRRGMSQIED